MTNLFSIRIYENKMINIKPKKVLLAIIIAIVLVVICFLFYSKNVNYSVLPKENINQQVDKIIIRNKTENDLIKSECILTDSISINKFLSELNELKPVSNAKTNINSGFYEILFLLKEAEINELRVIYTRYDGVVIKAKGSLYKNDRMESLALYYLQQKNDCK